MQPCVALPDTWQAAPNPPHAAEGKRQAYEHAAGVNPMLGPLCGVYLEGLAS